MTKKPDEKHPDEKPPVAQRWADLRERAATLEWDPEALRAFLTDLLDLIE